MQVDPYNESILSRQINDLLREKNVVEALRVVEAEIQKESTRPYNYALKAFIHSFTGDFAAARTNISIALSLGSNDPEVLAKCAVSLRVSGRLDLVIELLFAIPFVPQNPGSVGVRFELLFSIMSLAKLRRRLKHIRKFDAVSLFSSDNSLAKQGLLLAKDGDLENSVNLLKAELVKNPLSPDILAILGCIAIENSQPAVAHEYLGLALQLEPRNSRFLYLSAVATLQSASEHTHYVRAFENLRLAHELDPNLYPALEQLSAAAMFLHNYTASDRYFSKLLQLRSERLQNTAFHSVGLALLSHNWVTNIGHYWGLETFVKMVLLGKTHYKAAVLVCAQRPANPALLSYFDSFIKFSTEPAEAKILHTFSEEYFWTSEYASIAGGSLAYIQRPLAELDQEWERSGRGPLLTLRPDHEEHGWKMLETLGAPRGSWFVSMHVRSMGFYEHGSFGSHNEARNASIENYFEAIKAITDRGGWVIRMGDPSMPKLPPMPNVIDYAHSSGKSDWMDVFLWAKCKFFVGTQSGPQNIPPMFGVPVVMVNMISIRGLAQFLLRRDVAIPKLYWSLTEKRLLTFPESLSEPYSSIFSNAATLKHYNVELLENTSDEIRSAVEEMIEKQSGAFKLSSDELNDHDKLLTLLPEFKRLGFSQLIGNSFLRKHRALL